MSKATIKNNRLILLSLCIFFLFISCINELDSEISPGTVPIKFTTKINKTNTRVTNTAFDKGDKVGLYAMLSSTPITEKRYIDNLQLECGEKNVFIPEKTVFLSDRRCHTQLHQLLSLPIDRNRSRTINDSCICTDQPKQRKRSIRIRLHGSLGEECRKQRRGCCT